jgi:RNA-directed DNA polymerase
VKKKHLPRSSKKIVDNLEEPFVFLGYVFKKGYYHSPTDKAVGKFKKRIKEVTKRNPNS